MYLRHRYKWLAQAMYAWTNSLLSDRIERAIDFTCGCGYKEYVTCVVDYNTGGLTLTINDLAIIPGRWTYVHIFQSSPISHILDSHGSSLVQWEIVARRISELKDDGYIRLIANRHCSSASTPRAESRWDSLSKSISDWDNHQQNIRRRCFVAETWLAGSCC